MMNFIEAVSTCFSKYATFSGRATRSEYWWFYLFTILFSIAVEILATVFFPASSDAYNSFTVLMSAAMLMPTLAVACRRLHDIGRSGWWQLIGLTIIGLIPLIIWLATNTKSEGDKYNEV